MQFENQLKLFIDSVTEIAFSLLDTAGTVKSWNAGAERILGFQEEEIVGKHFSKIYPLEEVVAQKASRDLEMAEKAGKHEGESSYLKKDGSTLCAKLSIYALKDSQGKLCGFGIIFQTAGDDVVSVASHEMRTPLTALTLHLEMTEKLLSTLALPDSVKAKFERSLDHSAKQVDTLCKLVDELHDVTRIQSGMFSYNYKQINLSELVSELCHSYEVAFDGANIALECHIQPEVEGYWDPSRLQQIVTNLISNVLKFAADSKVIVTLKADSQNAILTVKDSGPGIPHEKRNTIFERFERGANPSVSGLGLGLYISRQIAQGHGGTIEVQSEVGKGSTFFLRLPLRSQNETKK